MSTWPISPLSASDLDFAVVNYDFTGLTADALADLPNLETAMDGLLADLATSIADQTVLIDSMADDLDDLDTILSEVANEDLTQILADLAGVAAAGDGMLGDVTTSVG
ncbi:MAG TPA: hypothetical protein VJY15_11350 [Candidatus Acidoferrum sp.]|nr:hypothetical protein [Candidatus Acidoferrum sp.]